MTATSGRRLRGHAGVAKGGAASRRPPRPRRSQRQLPRRRHTWRPPRFRPQQQARPLRQRLLRQCSSRCPARCLCRWPCCSRACRQRSATSPRPGMQRRQRRRRWRQQPWAVQEQRMRRAACAWGWCGSRAVAGVASAAAAGLLQACLGSRAFRHHPRRCLDATPHVTLAPCGHRVLCLACTLALRQAGQPCPMCRLPIESYILRE